VNLKLIRSRPITIAIVATGIAAAMGGYIWRLESRPPIMEMHLFSLSKGQSALVRTPTDKRVLINGGGNSEIIRHLTSVLPFYSRRIDFIILTSPEKNNVSGLIDIVERYEVGRVYIPSVTLQSLGISSTTDRIYETFLTTLKRRMVPLQEISLGDDLEFDLSVSAKILFPEYPMEFAYSKTSHPLIIPYIIYGDTGVLLLGDATRKIQKYISTSSKDRFLPKEDSRNRILVISHGGRIEDMSTELMDLFGAGYLIYSKSVTGSSGISPVARSGTDLFSNIRGTRRYNLKQENKITIVSDGKKMELTI